jgi:hypothetical protein
MSNRSKPHSHSITSSATSRNDSGIFRPKFFAVLKLTTNSNLVGSSTGYLWRETTYPSLSTIARVITGTAWNGHRFFGLRPGRNRREDIRPSHAERGPGTADAALRRAASSATTIPVKAPR